MSSWRLLSQIVYANTEEEFKPGIEDQNVFLFSYLAVAQSGSATALGAVGRGLASRRLDHCFIRWRAGYVRQSGVLIHLFSNGGGEVWTVTITGLSSVAMLIDWFPVVRCKQSGRCVHMKNET